MFVALVRGFLAVLRPPLRSTVVLLLGRRGLGPLGLPRSGTAGPGPGGWLLMLCRRHRVALPGPRRRLLALNGWLPTAGPGRGRRLLTRGRLRHEPFLLLFAWPATSRGGLASLRLFPLPGTP